MKKLLQDLLTEYRAYVLTGIGLPAGMVFDTVLRVRNFLYERLGTAVADVLDGKIGVNDGLTRAQQEMQLLLDADLKLNG